MEPAEKEAIRARIDLVDLIAQYTSLKKAGNGKWKGLCPFHNERTPSFHVDPERGRWHCFGSCGEGGDVFKFLEKAESLTFMEAAERLAERAGVTLTRGGTPAEREAAKERQNEKDRLYAANDLARRFFREALQRVRFAQDYAHGRGLTHQTMEDFQVGFAPDDWSQLADYLLKRGVHPEDGEKAGLIFPSRRGDGSFTDKFRGRLIFPIFDVQEKVVAFGGRLIVEPPPGVQLPKYLNSPETPVFSKSKILYGLNRARKAISERDLVLVVEGYMDVVACHQAGIENVIATLGTSLTDEHVRTVRRYTKNVVLSFDADDAGVKAALRAAELFQANGNGEEFTLRVLVLPQGEDPDSMLTQRGDVAGFNKAIEKALTVPEFRLLSVKKKYDTKTDEGKIAYLREAVAIVGEVRSPLEQDLLIRRLAPLHPGFSGGGVARAEESIRAEVRRHRARVGPAPVLGMEDADIPPPQQNGSGALRGPVYGGGGNGGGNGYGGGYNNGPRRFNGGGNGYGAPPPPPEPPLPQSTVSSTNDAATVRAERTVLRALLSEDYGKRVAGILQTRYVAAGQELSELFDDFGNVLLADAVLPLVIGGYSPTAAVTSLADGPLTSYADRLLLGDEGDEPLTDQGIADCFRRLDQRRSRAESRRIAEQVAEAAGGNAPADDELLRQWEARVRAAKRGGDVPGGPDGSGEDI